MVSTWLFPTTGEEGRVLTMYLLTQRSPEWLKLYTFFRNTQRFAGWIKESKKDVEDLNQMFINSQVCCSSRDFLTI